MTKTLYFEGAGMDFYSNEQTDFSDVGNFRIRTAFKNNDGKEIYLELGSGTKYTFIDKKGKKLKDPKIVTRWALYCDFAFLITGSGNECNESSIKPNWINTRDNFMYTKEDITKWVNENFNCSFETIEVLDFFYGYRVHGNKRGYNLMENIELNHERAAKRKAAYEKIDTEYRKALNEKYSQISLQEMDHESITIRCYASDSKIGELPRVKRIKIV